jgi:NAD(P)-dependent dehydrogenase (short-subunit alcohol dehydrogenase family)
MKIENSVFLITGGCAGIGEELAKYFHEKGGIVYICDIKEPNSSLKKIKYIKCDVTNEEEVKNVIQVIKEEQGRLEVVINNAGIAMAEFIINKGKLHRTDKFVNAWKVNTLGTFLVCKYATALMTENVEKHKECNGVIINIASVAGIDSPSSMVAYGSSKAAVIGMTLPMARDLKRFKIRVVSVAPGFIDTQMFAMVKEFRKETDAIVAGKPIHICQTCDYIISCDYINGTTIRVDNIFATKF